MKYLFAFYALITAKTFFAQSSDLTYVTIGKQKWMQTNLEVSTFQNGDSIPQVTREEDWIKASENKQPAWCYFSEVHFRSGHSTNSYVKEDGTLGFIETEWEDTVYVPAEGGKYGKLYNWYAVNDPRGLAPKGWHIPNNEEWMELINFLGGENYAASKMKRSEDWVNSEEDNNSSGFTALPGGYRNEGCFFSCSGIKALFWSASEENSENAWSVKINKWGSDVDYNPDHKKYEGLNIRCIKD